ncbi:hypothetical protein [Spirillospora sp. CA-294931]|uniref:hypothetical protein n=1 Tax=Spirillospora sp. CA-294931 TaxID=3240042 RepID=UPI003D8A0E7A
MTSYIVVFGLIVVVALVLVLVILGVRARAAGEDDDDWMADEQPKRGRRAAPQEEPAHEEYGTGYDNGAYAQGPDQNYDPAYDQQQGYDQGYDQSYDQGNYDQGYDQAPDRRVAGGPLAAPAPAAPASPPPPVPSGQASDEMEDDDYWATITFDKPKFPWQHDKPGEEAEPSADPLNAVAEQQQLPPEHQGLTQPVSMGAPDPRGQVAGGQGGRANTGPHAVPPPPPSFPAGGPAFGGGDPSATISDPIGADAVSAHAQNQYGPGDQSPYGQPEQPSYGGQDQQPYPVHDQPGYGSEQPSYGSDQPSYGGDQPAYGSEQPAYGTEQPSYASEQPSYGGEQPSYGGGDQQSPYGTADPSPYGTQDQPSYGGAEPSSPYGLPEPAAASGVVPQQASPLDVPSDPLGLPLGRAEEPSPGRGFGDSLATSHPTPPPAPPAQPAQPAAAAGGFGGAPNDTDNHKLPTVDELLQRIQNDRQRSSGSGGGSESSYGGGALSDPLNDPLGTSSLGNTGPWNTQGASSSEGPTGGFSSNTGGYGTPSQSEGYPSSPYGDSSPRYDDPLGGGRDSSYPAPTPSYGSDQGGGEPGRYGDFSGSSYNGGSDPLSTESTSGYGDPGATQAYTPGYFGDSQPGYPQTPTGENPAPYGTYNTDSNRQQDDWESHRDYRR